MSRHRTFLPPRNGPRSTLRLSATRSLVSVIAVALSLLAKADVRAACPPGYPNPITSGDPATGPRVVLTGLGPAPTGSFFLLGAGDLANSGTLPATAWLRQAGDVDGDGWPDWYVDAPGAGPGGWGDPATVGCPSFVTPDHPPLVILVQHAVEDRDRDGRFDVFEDLNRNGLLELFEDRDGDGRLTPPGGCEGVLREDSDCDGRVDIFNEDLNGNGILDVGEDLDGDARLDAGDEDRNHNNALDDRPFLFPDDPIRDELGRLNPLYPYGEQRPARGGTFVLVVAWNGQSYSLQSISEPGTLVGPEEDLDHDGRFDVFEDLNRNRVLNPGEDRDGDGRLTPPDGCEGVLREDTDCDGRLDIINEDYNGNGILDPGEDVDQDGRLDAGNEDRNHNHVLDDRPGPQPSDSLGSYPYGLFLPRPLRLLAAGPAIGLAEVTGAHTDPRGNLRVRFDSPGLRLYSDPAVPGPVFDRLHLAIDGFSHPPGPSFPDGMSFVESGSPRLDLPAASNLGAGGFFSIEGAGARISHPIVPIEGRAGAAGSEAFLAGPGAITSLALSDLLDPDGDGIPLPIDPCPALHEHLGLDGDLDGIGNACEPAPPSDPTVADRWVALDPAGGPGLRHGAAAAFDAALGVTVLFGGSADAATWEFDGSAWSSYATTPGPAPRRGHGMAWDADRRRVVLYGGRAESDGRLLADHWEYDAARHRWAERSMRVTPGPRVGFGLARDERLRALILFGGRGEPGLLGDTWMFRLGMWRRVPSAQFPAPREAAMLAWDARRERTVLLGGRAPSPLFGLLDDIWEFDGAAWQPVDARGDLPPTAAGTLVYDSDRRELVLIGGDTLRLGTYLGVPMPPLVAPTAATRRFDGVRLAPLPTLDTTEPHAGHAAAFDAARGTIVVHGGTTPAGATHGTALLIRSGDADGDGIADADDDCPALADAGQADADGDDVGDLCDNCPGAGNPDQRDLDRDLLGDACDDDRDGDGVANPSDVCPDAYVAGRPIDTIGAGGGGDRDGDGRADDCDRCPDDPADDRDGDGWCAGEDNCPATANPMQEDGDQNGTGDACQPVVRILSIEPIARPRNTLNARVQVRDPDGNPLSGRIEITRSTVLPEVLGPGLDPCAAAWTPDGAPGGGLIYAIVPGTTPVITDVDSIFGCVDGIADFEFFDGTCAAGAGQFFADAITIDRPAPFPICVRRLDGSGAEFDMTLRAAGSDAAILSGPEGPIVAVEWRDRLPLYLPLAPLGTAGSYLLRITASDGETPPVSDERGFAWSGERLLYFNLPAWLTGS